MTTSPLPHSDVVIRAARDATNAQHSGSMLCYGAVLLRTKLLSVRSTVKLDESYNGRLNGHR